MTVQPIDEITVEVTVSKDKVKAESRKKRQPKLPMPAIGTELYVPADVGIQLCRTSKATTFRAKLNGHGEWEVKTRNDEHGGFVLRTSQSIVLGKEYTATVTKYTQRGNSAWVKLAPVKT